MRSRNSDMRRTGWMSTKLRGLLRLLGAESSDIGRPEKRRRTLSVELLESRTLLSWTALGPMPQFNDPTAITAVGGGDVPGNISGKVTALAYGVPRPGSSAALFLGSAGGG